ncbi:MAG: hypothetical protein SGI88_01495 [Candidatus Hydrogenedentes bacterium]|nr:hypothetical protein [Candidatus Hydrogenedentota bacterium]
MDQSTFPFIFIGLVIIGSISAIGSRLVAGGRDKKRIAEYLASRGSHAHSIRWAPFSIGFLSERTARFYQVQYVDVDGNEHDATSKTKMFSGVYWTEDENTHHARILPVEQSHEELARENERLREELDRLNSNRQP